MTLRSFVTANRWLFAALLLGLAIRVPLMVAAQHDSVPGDQLQYSAQALGNARGDWFAQPFDNSLPAAEHPPLTSAVLTPVTWLALHSNFILAQRLAVFVVGLANIVLLYLLGRRFSPTVGSITALLGAIDAHLFLGDVLILSETFAVTLMTLLLLVLDPNRHRSHSRRRLATAGALVGLLLLTRAELLLLVPLVGLWVWWSRTDRGRRSAMFDAAIPAAVALVVIAPWVLWNMSRFEERTLLSTNDGFTLLGANCDDTYYGANIGGYSINCALAVEGDPGQDASQVSAARRQVAVAFAGDHLGRLPLVAGARFIRQWELGWIGRTAGDSPAEGRPELLVLLGSVQWWLYGAVGMFGLRRISGSWLGLLALAPVVVTFVGVVFNAQWRVRAAAEPAIVLLAALGVFALLERRRPESREREPLVHPDR